MIRIIKGLAALAAGMLVASCGGGGADAGSPPFGGGDGAAPVASDMTLTLSTTNISNAGTLTVDVEVTAVNASRVALPDIPVSFSVDSNAVLVVGGTATDANGKVYATVGIGSDKSNRIVTVQAVSGTLVRTASFQVTGANLQATAVPSILAPGASGQVQYRLTDVSGNPISGQTVAITGNGIAPAQGATDNNGEFVLQYTAPAQLGTLTLVANGAGDSETVSVLVQTGSGSIPAVTAGSVLSASVAADPSVVSVNTDTTNNRAEIRALFRGANNAPIANVRVRFDLDGDPNSIGGIFTSGANIVYADVNGIATTAYVPGSRSSPTDGVIVRACWGNTDAELANGACPNAARATLTVISEALGVSIGHGGLLLVGGNDLTYIKQFAVLVVDASGRAKAGVQITPSIDLLRYYKGQWFVTPTQWVQTVLASCGNEDLNRNGILEAATEDMNLTGSLEPRKSDVSIRIVGSNQTDASGIVVVQIEYPQSHGSWIDYRILVSASGVNGTEGRATFQGNLPVLAEAVDDEKVDPPFRFSPYGLEGSPTVPAVTQSGQPVSLCTNPN